MFFCFSWHLDPSGTYTLYQAKAIGSGSEGAQSSLQEVYHKVCVCVCVCGGCVVAVWCSGCVLGSGPEVPEFKLNSGKFSI